MFSYFYLNINGRCSRKIYWLVGVLPFFILGIAAFFISEALHINELAIDLFFLILLWPVLAMQIKRLHDINLSGWFCVLSLIPYLGVIFQLIIGFIPGSKSQNKFGTP
ncbi:MAG: DUF805 domain-containing protein [Gammaproteobacteria bacterium]|nr:DUF805 domain-containing protein [Gammaproteobacteria bacterium]